jgi:hypothetical protein
MGKWIEDGDVIVFLTKQDRTYIVRAGDTLDRTYRVEKIEEDRLVLNYLPLGIRQTLQFAAAPPPAGTPPQPSLPSGPAPQPPALDIEM